ncbi:MAG: methyltransferase domain-containing protein [Burkholderiales bacterium]
MAQDSSKADFWDSRYRDQVTPWDAGKVPALLQRYADNITPGARILIPGCGSAHEAAYLARRGFDVLAIDFSEAAIEVARKNLAGLENHLRVADFFDFDVGQPYDVIYERAFLCALPPRIWPQYGPRTAQLLRSGGELAGFFFLRQTERGPPFGVTADALHALLDPHFALIEDQAVTDSIPVFQGGERWQVWRRH